MIVVIDYDDVQPESIIMVTGGIGVTPMLSIIDGNPDIPMTVFHSATVEASLIYGEKFAQWEEKRDNFKAYRSVGLFEPSGMDAYLPKDKSKVMMLVSGPGVMANFVIKESIKRGVPRSQIFYEEFGW